MAIATLVRTCLLLSAVAFASAAIAETAHNSPESAIFALRALQDKEQSVFVVQGELDPVIRQGGGGACASAAAIDAIQALRLMAGMEPLANPHKAALAAIGRQGELLNGRVSNEQMVAFAWHPGISFLANLR